MATRQYFYSGLILSLMSVSQIGFAQDTENFVRTFKARVPLQGDLSTVNDKSKVQQITVYYDGLGRQIQSVLRQGSPGGYDVVSVWTFDRYGKKSKTYLPYVSSATSGQFQPGAIADQQAFFTARFGATEGSNAFSTEVHEISELSRALKMGAVGAAWQPNNNPADYSDRTVKLEYTTNLTEEVLLWKFDPATKSISARSGGNWQYYPMNELHVTRTYDEHNQLVIEYKDKSDKVILKRVQATASQSPVDDTNFASTYYVYDDRGKLFTVIPPEAVKQLKSN